MVMEYLSLQEIRSRSEAITTALDALIRTKTVANKPNAKQWRFLRDCVRCLLTPGADSEFRGLSPVQAAQLKFEVEDRLKRYYLRPGRPVDILFTMVHKSDLATYGVADDEAYPSLAGYCVLARDHNDGREDKEHGQQGELRTYLERVVTESVDAEFQAYASLPQSGSEELKRWFCADGPALKEIMNLLTRHQKRGWVLSNPLNPSTKRLLSIKVKKITGSEAVVNTMEYWYLRWYDAGSGSYTYIYRETNRQIYIVKKETEGWKIFQNLRPSPRSSIPHRWKKKQKT
jgi:hypothetical protein